MSERKVRGPTRSDRISRSQSIRCASLSRLLPVFWISTACPQCGGSFAQVGAGDNLRCGRSGCSRKTRVPARRPSAWQCDVHHGRAFRGTASAAVLVLLDPQFGSRRGGLRFRADSAFVASDKTPDVLAVREPQQQRQHREQQRKLRVSEPPQQQRRGEARDQRRQ
jgi:hypothetical protein